MALTDRLMNNLRISLPGALDGVLKLEIWNMVNEWCREGRGWREVIEVPLVIGDDTYTGIEPTETEIVHVESISHPTLDVMGSLFEFGSLILKTAPVAADVASPIHLVAFLAPSLDADPANMESLVPEDMWSEHHQAFLHGVLGRTMSQPAKPYTNPTLAVYHLRAFKGAMAQNRYKVRVGGAVGAQNWRFPRWAS
jgi:hypothetical protein